MTARFELKVKVALGFSKLILLLLLSLSLHAQSSDELLQRNVTIIGRNIDFEDVLEQLTLQTKMRFIYSSSTVSLNKPVTLMARQQPLKNVLDDISAQMNITFKRQGDYFVVKKDLSIAKTHFTLAQPKLANSEEIDEDVSALSENSLQASRLNTYSIAQYDNRDPEVTKDLMNFGDKLKLKYQPLLQSDHLNTRPKMRWFASAGVLLNDYSVGLEMQGGIPLVHAIVNVSALGDGMYRLGYGLGTSIPIKPVLSANLAYTFASINRNEVDSWHNNFQASSHHHQIRLMANLTLSNHFSVRIGPTFNLLRTSYQYLPEPGAQVTTIRYRSAPTQQYLSPSQGYSQGSYSHYVQHQSFTTPGDYQTTNSWVGFELGVAYRVNFSLRK